MATIPKDMKYEDALSKIQDILTKLENKEVSMDDLTENIALAKKLFDFCQEKLTRTEKDIEKIIDLKK